MKVNCLLSKSQIETWLADLRSGEFKQTKQSLKDADGYCCLGVLAQRLGTLEEAQKVNEETVVRGRHVLGDAVESELIVMNDGGKSFAAIADFVEATILPQAPAAMVPGALEPAEDDSDDSDEDGR